MFAAARDASNVEGRVRFPPAAPAQMACRPTAGRRTLAPKIEVQILAGQPGEGGWKSFLERSVGATHPVWDRDHAGSIPAAPTRIFGGSDGGLSVPGAREPVALAERVRLPQATPDAGQEKQRGRVAEQ